MKEKTTPILLTRDQAHALVQAWCAPHLWIETHREIDARYDAEEDGVKHAKDGEGKES
jgi:hypothetical protein